MTVRTLSVHDTFIHITDSAVLRDLYASRMQILMHICFSMMNILSYIINSSLYSDPVFIVFLLTLYL